LQINFYEIIGKTESEILGKNYLMRFELLLRDW
jgi:hypothetical protein